MKTYLPFITIIDVSAAAIIIVSGSLVVITDNDLIRKCKIRTKLYMTRVDFVDTIII